MDNNIISRFKNSKLIQFGFLLIIFLILYFSISHEEGNNFWRFPPLLKAVPLALNEFIYETVYGLFPIKTWDPIFEMWEEKSSIRIATQFFSQGLNIAITFVRELLLGGTKTIKLFISDSFVTSHHWHWFAIPWPAFVAATFFLGQQLGGTRLGLLGAIGTTYIAVFGQWVPSIETFSFVVVTTPICFVLGLSLGIWGYLSKRVETALQPVLNVMQTMPQFAYLVPIIALFGLGDHAGSLATIVIATPPMIRNTILGLKKYPQR